MPGTKVNIFSEGTKIWRNLPQGFDVSEGQLILECLLGVIDFPKNQRKF